MLCDLQAEFVANKNEQKLVANEVALEDHVQLVSNGTWEGSHDSWLVQKGDPLTVTAEEFGNIYLVTVVAYWEYDSEHSTATVVNAIGPAIKNLDDLGVMEPVKPVKSTKKIDENEEDMLTYNFRFKDGVRLSDVTLEFGADVCIYSVKAYLDVTAELPDGETNLVGDDKLLIAKRSNAINYVYAISIKNDNIK